MPVLDPVRLIGRRAEAPAPVGLVFGVIALEPEHAAFALERQDMGDDAVEEPAVVADDDRAPGETLERLLQRPDPVPVGHEKPDAGSLKLGDTVKLAYIDQSREHLVGGNSVFEEVSGGTELIELGKKSVNARAYLAGFAFKGTDQQKRVKDLSGGERNRVHLAKLLKQGANLLLLDEPSNDLDVETLRSLEEGLLGFAGCAVVISHDRWFLDRIATHILAFEGDSKVVWFEGNYQDYEADRRRRLGAEADRPHRIKYRKLTR